MAATTVHDVDGGLTDFAVVFYFLARTARVRRNFVYVCRFQCTLRAASDVRASFVTLFISNSNKTCMAQCPEVVFTQNGNDATN